MCDPITTSSSGPRIVRCQRSIARAAGSVGVRITLSLAAISFKHPPTARARHAAPARASIQLNHDAPPSPLARQPGVIDESKRLAEIRDDVTRPSERRLDQRRPPRVQRRLRPARSEEHTSELQSHSDLVCRLLLEKKKK